MSGMEVFTPLVRTVMVDGVTLTVGPLKARQFAAVQKAMRPVATYLAGDEPHNVLVDGLDDLIALLSAATGQDAGWFADRDPAVLLPLLGEVITVNQDFSRRRLTPAWVRLGAVIVGMDGAPSSPPSADAVSRSPAPST